MSHFPLIVSPADNADWFEFLEQHLNKSGEVAVYNTPNKPDLTDVICWLQNHINLNNYIAPNLSSIDIDKLSKYISKNYEPDDIFDDEQIGAWAEDRNYFSQISDFEDEKVLNYVVENFNLEDVYGFDKLADWADFNDFVHKDTIIDTLSEQIHLLKKKNND